MSDSLRRCHAMQPMENRAANGKNGYTTGLEPGLESAKREQAVCKRQEDVASNYCGCVDRDSLDSSSGRQGAGLELPGGLGGLDGNLLGSVGGNGAGSNDPGGNLIGGRYFRLSGASIVAITDNRANFSQGNPELAHRLSLLGRRLRRANFLSSTGIGLACITFLLAIFLGSTWGWHLMAILTLSSATRKAVSGRRSSCQQMAKFLRPDKFLWHGRKESDIKTFFRGAKDYGALREANLRTIRVNRCSSVGAFGLTFSNARFPQSSIVVRRRGGWPRRLPASGIRRPCPSR